MTDINQQVGLRETLRRLRSILPPLGLGKRPAHLPIGNTPHRVVYRENKMSVLRYDTGAKQRFATPILLIPSLINRYYIFDLLPQKSIVEYFANAGFVVTTIDWGAPGDEDRDVHFDRYITGYLQRAVKATAQQAGSDQVVMVGYCLGGTLAAIYASLFPQKLQSLVLLTTPIDFEQSGLLGTWVKTKSFDVDTLTTALGNIPWALLQASFQMLRPTLSINKAKGVLERYWDDQFLDGVLALETWGSDNISFPGQCYRTFIEDLYRNNALARGNLAVAGRPVDLANINCPVLNIFASYDHIVPYRASHALNQKMDPNLVTEWNVKGGHIGAVVSRKAMEKVWPATHAWILEHTMASST